MTSARNNRRFAIGVAAIGVVDDLVASDWLYDGVWCQFCKAKGHRDDADVIVMDELHMPSCVVLRAQSVAAAISADVQP